jgi:uncharacterized OB-fold protein
MTMHRPLPDVHDPLYAPYFAGLRRREILVEQCNKCGHRQFPPRERCFNCHGDDLTWAPAPKEGVVYTYMVAHRAFDPWFKDRLPYGLVVADLGDGIRIMAPYADTDVDDLECGIKVRAFFERIDDDVTLLLWERA